jgi:hypothetical protein
MPILETDEKKAKPQQAAEGASDPAPRSERWCALASSSAWVIKHVQASRSLLPLLCDVQVEPYGFGIVQRAIYRRFVGLEVRELHAAVQDYRAWYAAIVK